MDCRQGLARGWAVVATIALGASIVGYAQSKTPGSAKPPAKPVTTPRGEDENLYRNAALGFHFRIPYGWVNRTKQIQEAGETGKGEVLLAVFERPPDAAGSGINVAVVIASESAASYPGLKRAEDYVGPLTEVATAKGFKVEGEPYALEVESRQLVRADFTKQLSPTLTMRQCTLVSLYKGQIISFTFVAGGEEELDDLMDGLHFAAGSPTRW
jgi:hypothetical protein